MRVRLLSLSLVVLASGGAGQAAAGPIRVALLPIVVHSAEPDAAYVSSGLAAMLSARLERSGQIAVVRVDGASPVADEAEAVQAARDSGADFVVFGSFTQFGQGASFDVRCTALDAGEAVAPGRQVFIHSGSIGEIIPRLDELAEKLARHVEGRAVPVAGGANGSAASGEALGELQRRVEALERAVYLGGAAAPGQEAEEGVGALSPLPIEGGDATVR